MKDKIVQTLIAVSILAGFIAFIAVEWEYMGKIIFALMTIWRKSPYFSRGMDSPK